MAHFAELDDNNKVKQVIVVNNSELLDENGVESEDKGIAFCQSLFGGTWIQTFYNGTFRKNYAGIGYTYDPVLDHFFGPKPYESWVFNSETANWDPPIPNPSTSTRFYKWNEELIDWELRLVLNEDTGDWEPPTQ